MLVKLNVGLHIQGKPFPSFSIMKREDSNAKIHVPEVRSDYLLMCGRQIVGRAPINFRFQKCLWLI
jgi:hypothetical protein